MYKIDSWWKAAIKHRKFSLALTDDLEEWDERVEGGPRWRGYVYIYIVDSHCGIQEANNTVKQLSSNFQKIL